ncbi:class I SAM-dependent methyltransferase [Streptomyces sp. NPDC093252]|uniref:SAM-dependent methyltransferase n=1 Tax=Streptomyces sp. NPDC093252 TaxID=3154980 RepID=UPI003434BA7A
MTAPVTNRHYDRPPELFELFLDRRMKYTSGLYTEGTESLDEAQEAKLRFIARLLGLRGGERVLDIGSGWGSMVLFLAADLGCEVTAVTPSPRQAAFIRARAEAAGVAGRVTVEATPFERAVLPEGAFDAVSAVGVLEHLPDHTRALTAIRRLLKRRGRVYASSSCYRSAADRAEYATRPASEHAVEVFGYTAMPTLSGLVAAFEDAGLTLSSLTDLTADYRRTITAWQQRIAARRERMEVIEPGFADELARYLTTANASWGYTAKHYALSAVKGRKGELLLPGGAAATEGPGG